MLLPGIVFTFVVAFLVTTVALDIGLIGRPFRLRLFLVLSVLRTLIIVRTGFALSGIELHFLQSVVIVVLGRNIPLDLYVSPALVNTFLFYLSFIDTLVDLERNFVYFLEYRRATVAPGDLILNHVL
jgi:hypothetical protein